MPELSLRHYKAILLVHELSSFTLAAKKTYVSVPALSKIIKEAEDIVEFSIFQRSPRSVRLTEDGERLIDCVRRVIAAHDNAAKTITGIRNNTISSLRIAGTQVVNATFLHAAIRDYSKAHPDMKIEVLDARADDIDKDLSRGFYDLMIGPRRSVGTSIAVEDICEIPLYFVVPRSFYPDRSSVMLEELRGKRIIFLDSQAPLHVFKYLDKSFDIDSWEIISNVTTALCKVENNLGYMISAAYIEKLTKAYDVDFVKIVEPEVFMPLSIYASHEFMRSAERAGLQQEVMQHIRRYIGTLNFK